MNARDVNESAADEPDSRTPQRLPLSEADLPRSVEDIDAALVRLMAETEATVIRLRAELADRRQHEAQHAEIERLEEHLAEATVNWAKVKAFFEEVLRELIGRRVGVAGADGVGAQARHTRQHDENSAGRIDPGTEKR